MNYTPRCSEVGCDRAARGKGLCGMHYQRAKFSDPNRPRCAIEGCDRPLQARSWCHTHYYRWRKYGDPLAPAPKQPRKIKIVTIIDTDYTDQEIDIMAIPNIEDPNWDPKVAKPSYDSVRHHLRAAGPPSSHRCHYCGQEAEVYTYDRSDPGTEAIHSTRGRQVLYSWDPANYQPSCKSCAHDLAEEHAAAS